MKYKELIEAHGLTLHGDIEHFAELVAAQEREACADIAENWRSNGSPRVGVAEQIRARGNNMTGYKSKRAAATMKMLHTYQDDDGSAHLKNLTMSNLPNALKQPEQSEWKCYMFGHTPKSGQGIVWTVPVGKEPNWFVRWMMKVCFACTWEKNT